MAKISSFLMQTTLCAGEGLIRQAADNGETELTTTGNLHNPVVHSEFNLNKQPQKVAQTIQVGEQPRHRQQTYFIRDIGWNTHNDMLNTHEKMLGVLSIEQGSG